MIFFRRLGICGISVWSFCFWLLIGMLVIFATESLQFAQLLKSESVVVQMMRIQRAVAVAAATLAFPTDRLELAMSKVLPIPTKPIDVLFVIDRMNSRLLRIGLILFFAADQALQKAELIRA